jgi:hypothetical protein
VIKYVMDEAAKTTEENCLMFSEPDKPKEVQKQLYTPIIKAAQNAMACQFSEGAATAFGIGQASPDYHYHFRRS